VKGTQIPKSVKQGAFGFGAGGGVDLGAGVFCEAGGFGPLAGVDAGAVPSIAFTLVFQRFAIPDTITPEPPPKGP